MRKRLKLMIGATTLVFGWGLQAEPTSTAGNLDVHSVLQDLDPSDLKSDQILRDFDRVYEDESGSFAYIDTDDDRANANKCYQSSCPVWIVASKKSQVMELYINGVSQGSWPISTGVEEKFTTPDFESHPTGRFYEGASAIFIRGGYALFGVGKDGLASLGHESTHGSIGVHPDNAKRLGRLVKQYGVSNIWVSVH